MKRHYYLLKISYSKWVYLLCHHTPAFSLQSISLSYFVQTIVTLHSAIPWISTRCYLYLWGPAFSQSNSSFHQRWRYSWSPFSSPLSSLPARELVLEVLEVGVQSAMMDPDLPALMAQHLPVEMGPPLSLTETCDDLFKSFESSSIDSLGPPSRVLTTASLTTALMARGQTPALMAAPPALADPEARGVPRRRESAAMDQLRHLTGTSPLPPARMAASPSRITSIQELFALSGEKPNI